MRHSPATLTAKSDLRLPTLGARPGGAHVHRFQLPSGPHHYLWLRNPIFRWGEVSAISFSANSRFGRDAGSEALEQRVSSLQDSALAAVRGLAGRWTESFRRQVTAAIPSPCWHWLCARVYREPISSPSLVWRRIGLQDRRQTPMPPTLPIESRLCDHAPAYASTRRSRRCPRPINPGFAFTTAAAASRWTTTSGRVVSLLRPDHGERGRPVLSRGHVSDGQGVPQDFAEAAKSYHLAADRGDARARYDLGLSYAKGETGEPDSVSAYIWFDLAHAFPASEFPSQRCRHQPRRGGAR